MQLLLSCRERSSQAARKKASTPERGQSGPMRCQFGPPWLLDGGVAPRVANFKQTWMLGCNTRRTKTTYVRVELYGPWSTSDERMRRWWCCNEATATIASGEALTADIVQISLACVGRRRGFSLWKKRFNRESRRRARPCCQEQNAT
jgi:hypothetical protein